MAARPLWEGQIRLSLVSIPVERYSATTAAAPISFRQMRGREHVVALKPCASGVRGEKPTAGRQAENVVDLMAALKQSLEKSKPAKTPAPRKKKSA